MDILNCLGRSSHGNDLGLGNNHNITLLVNIVLVLNRTGNNVSNIGGGRKGGKDVSVLHLKEREG